MNRNTRRTGRLDLSIPRPTIPAGTPAESEAIVEQSRQKTPGNQQPIDMASLPDYVVIVIDGIRLDAKKVLDLMGSDQMQYFAVAQSHNETLTYVNATSLVGKRTILLSELVVNDKLYMGTTCFSARFAQRYFMQEQHALQPEPTPVDLGSITAETIILVGNAKIKAGKLYKLLAKTESKGQIAPVTQPKFNFSVIDTVEDRGIHGRVSIESLIADGVYWFNGKEFDGIDIDRLIDLNLRKLDPRSPRQRLTDSVTASWKRFKTDAKALHKQHSMLMAVILVIITGYLLLDTAYTLSNPSNVATLNLLHYLQDPANGFTAYNEILRGVSLDKQFTTINLTFMAIGGWMGYHDFSGSHKYSGPIGALIGILVSRVVQFLVVIVIASTLH